MDVRTKFGKRLRELRLKKNITQEKLATEAGFHRTYAGNIERGLENPTIEAVARLADVLEVPPSAMFDFETVTDEQVDAS
jgi:transcriptional regulator with XRE-family HTH domain